MPTQTTFEGRPPTDWGVPVGWNEALADRRRSDRDSDADAAFQLVCLRFQNRILRGE